MPSPTRCAGAADETSATTFFIAVPLLVAAVGAVVALRRPAHPIGWLLLVAGWLFALSALAHGYAAHAVSAPPTPALARWGPVVEELTFFPAFVLVGFYLPLLFPDGTLPSRRWRVVGWATGVATAAETLAVVLRPGPFASFPALTNPLGTDALGPVARVLETFASILFVPLLAAVAVAVIVRLLRSTGIARQQFKWVALPAVLFFVFVPVNEARLDLGPVGAAFLEAMFVLGFGGLPVGVGIAVLRYRLYEIDRIISRTVAYALLSLLLLGVYAAGVVALSALLPLVTGGAASDVVVAASTLAAAAVFQPARRRIQTAVDRRFNRTRYDAQRTVEAFVARLRDEVDVVAVTDTLRDVAAATVQPTGVSLWLRGQPR